jgi:hypothetical protein
MGNQPNPGTHFLDANHHWKNEQWHPHQMGTVLRSSLGKGCHPRRVIIRRPGDKAGTEGFGKKLLDFVDLLADNDRLPDLGLNFSHSPGSCLLA